MRLWHQALIPRLPREQLLGQHRECCALRGKGWNKKHSTVDYVFRYSYFRLYTYHLMVMGEMIARGYKVTPAWTELQYRGKQIGYDYSTFTEIEYIDSNAIYPEHNKQYHQDCIDNLKEKGIYIQGEENG
ncbi:MAG TPA: TIGR02328 family protein [Bacteroidales bacterium]|nr:TIGR02328 family protein [Bacteroidales bacterium]